MDRFVVGTGRCGSTLLSRMLASHDEVVTIHEFFTGLDWGRRFTPDQVTGPELVEIIGAVQPVTTEVLARGYTSDEIRYPFGSLDTRYAVGDPVPWLLVTMLSRLTTRPDGWFDELMDWASTRASAPLTEHYRAVFSWTAARAGGSIWVERSGSSLDYLADLGTMFPDARFVHIHRDGREAALSIREHPFFRLGVAVFMDLFPADLEPADAITHVIENAPPCWAVGRYWSDQVVRGFDALEHLNADHFLQVRFEDLVTMPRQVLTEVADFLALPYPPAFMDRASAMSHGLPPTRFTSLPPAEQAELTEACHPGQVLLGRAGGQSSRKAARNPA